MAARTHRLLSALLLGSLALPLHAAATAGLHMHILVLGGCTFLTPDHLVMDFGALNGGDRSISAVAPVNCTSGTRFTVRLSDGLYPAGTQRQMAQQNGSGRLPYTLVADPQSGLGNGGNIDIRLTATVRQADYANRPVGAYSDTVVLTVDP
ncbi:spore coat protein U domain-containing protein [Chitinilyticum piscinae]|uniref:Spore coat protein U domain-containing protein n=1 Tax=Chitinilyticum piscinae TaxID=2866724 RepID=A0A8J7KCW7_9NEIS|nr:spore coat protein U domain-containing protein [Chitinilyticum piscinae]MBE9608169.1 spore coat protein U domain-containing protein [Chitinilyticum piscinae]